MEEATHSFINLLIGAAVVVVAAAVAVAAVAVVAVAAVAASVALWSVNSAKLMAC